MANKVGPPYDDGLIGRCEWILGQVRRPEEITCRLINNDNLDAIAEFVDTLAIDCGNIHQDTKAVSLDGGIRSVSILSSRALLGALDVEFSSFAGTGPENRDGSVVNDGVCENLGSGVGDGVIANGKVGHEDLRLMSVQHNGASLWNGQVANRGANVKLEFLFGARRRVVVDSDVKGTFGIRVAELSSLDSSIRGVAGRVSNAVGNSQVLSDTSKES